MLSDYKEPRTPERMAAALRSLSSQPAPAKWSFPVCSTGLTGCRSGSRLTPPLLLTIIRLPVTIRCSFDLTARRIAVIVKGYPRLSETFIAQEILALEQRGLALEIWSLRHPTERAVHPHAWPVKARVTYLPEYLYEEPLRVMRGAAGACDRRFRTTIKTFWRDLKRDFTANRSAGSVRPSSWRGSCRRTSAPVCPLPPHAGLRRPLRRVADRPDLDLLGPCQGHLDHSGLGEAREDGGSPLGRDLHGAGGRASAGPVAAGAGVARLSRAGSFAVSRTAR